MDPSRLEFMEKRVREHPEDTFASYALAMEYTSAGRLEDAAATYEALRARKPDYLAIYYQLGKLLQRLGRIADARGAFEAGVAVAGQAGNSKTENELQEAIAALEP